MRLELQRLEAGGGTVCALGADTWRLDLPAGTGERYRLAQLDDYHRRARSDLPWRIPARLDVTARLSDAAIHGTWGFGFWNDPFSVNLGLGGMARRLPAGPNCAWFFYASPPNYLALRDDHPAQGFLAATFSSFVFPSVLLAPGLLLTPALFWPPAAAGLRRLARQWIREDATALEETVTEWHHYRIALEPDAVRFYVDGRLCLETGCVPQGRLGLVIWIDNQFAAFPADGRFRSGRLANEKAAWLEVAELQIN